MRHSILAAVKHYLILYNKMPETSRGSLGHAPQPDTVILQANDLLGICCRLQVGSCTADIGDLSTSCRSGRPDSDHPNHPNHHRHCA